MNDPSSRPLSLAAEFPPASRDQWRKLVDKALMGAPFERLVSRTYDGIPIEPLYARDTDATPLAGRPVATPWRVTQRVDHPDPATANTMALHDLENGTTGLDLVFAGSVGAYGFGIDAAEATLARALDDVHLDAGIGIAFDLGRDAMSAPMALIKLMRARGTDPSTVDMAMNFDPLGAITPTGVRDVAWAQVAPQFAAMTGELAALGFRGPFALADGRIVHNAGGSEAQELAFVLAVAVAYLRAFEAAGVALDTACAWISFKLSADTDQLLTMAKFRGLRQLWARIEDACGLAPQPTRVAAETAWRMTTRRDPHTNMLRATVAAAAAGLAGADAVTVLPFTLACGLPDEFARRVARNTQLVLMEEAHLDKVADSAAGAGAIDELTDRLCAAAWSFFQEIERAGGAAAALEAGLIQDKVRAVRAERERSIAHGVDALVGSNIFPHLEEAPATVLRPAPAPGKATAPGALPAVRLAEPFERLRDASDERLAQTGSRPKIFLATFGTEADFAARAAFARNFFEAGGIEPVQVEDAGTSSLPAVFKASGSMLACLCASDDVYAGEAVNAAKALAAAGASRIYLVGRPGPSEAALQSAGVTGYIHAGCDAVAILSEAQAGELKR